MNTVSSLAKRKSFELYLNSSTHGNGFIGIDRFIWCFTKYFLNSLLNLRLKTNQRYVFVWLNDRWQFFTLGIRLIPPTRMTSLISESLTSASLIAFLHGSKMMTNELARSINRFHERKRKIPIVRLIRLATRFSNWDRVTFVFICFGPEASIVKYGKLISV